MRGYKSYKELEVWKRTRLLAKEIYLITKAFPREEIYGLTSQMRRAATSIPSNIAEGYGRQYKKETIQYFYIARGSLFELETQLYVATDLGFLQEQKLEALLMNIEDCRKLLSGLIRYFETNESLN